MIEIFHGTNAESHNAFQAWRSSHPDGFNLTESKKNLFTAHWTQDLRDHGDRRGCNHQGGSENKFDEGTNCYTSAKKVCSDSLQELLAWAQENSVRVKACKNCDTTRNPFPVLVPELGDGAA